MNAFEPKDEADPMMLLLSATVRAIGSVLPANAEIVLHDLRNPVFSIVEIANPAVTGRKKGDSVLAGIRTDKAFTQVMARTDEPVSLLLDYPTFSREGKALRSSTVLYRNREGKPYAALCINVDNSGLEDAIHLLQSLAGIQPTAPEPQYGEPAPQPAYDHLPHDNIEDLMREIIDTTTGAAPHRSRAESKRANLLAVKNMQEKGIFLIKGGVEKAAAALGVTRYTIYNYLDELKNSELP